MGAWSLPLPRRVKFSILGATLVAAVVFDFGPVEARDCGDAKEAAACGSNEDCACGLDVTKTCTVAARECVSSEDALACYSSCSSLSAVCRGGRCVRAARALCPGDCDGDTNVRTPELVTSVAIALDIRARTACSSFDSRRAGGIRIDELVAAVTAGMYGCAEALPRDPHDRGRYDGRIESFGQIDGTYEVVANVSEAPGRLSLEIAVTPNAQIYATGSLEGSNLTLEGSYWVTDYVVPATGAATVENRGDEEVIEGMLMTPGAFASMTSFTLRRSFGVSAERFGGHYRFATALSPSGNGQASTFDFSILAAADGIALTTEGRDIGAAGELFGTIYSGPCSIAPQGHFQCATTYLIAGSNLAAPLRLTGMLTEPDSTEPASGRFLSGYDPPFGPEPYVPGRWTATRD